MILTFSDMTPPKVKSIVFSSPNLPGVFYNEQGMPCTEDGTPLIITVGSCADLLVMLDKAKREVYGDGDGGTAQAFSPMTKHEREVRKALKAFEPMVPPHVMSELEKVIERHLDKVRKFNEKSTKR